MENEKRIPQKGEEGREAWEIKNRKMFYKMCNALLLKSRLSYFAYYLPWKHEKPFSAFEEGFENHFGYCPKYDFECKSRKKAYRVGDLVVTSEMICVAFGSLSEVQKRAVFMHFVKGLTHREIARMEGEREACIVSRAHSGIVKMRKFLEKEGRFCG